MFERFTNGSRQVVVLAQSESTALKHDYIGTEHLLLGLLREGEGIAFCALSSLGVTLDGVRAEVIARSGEGDEVVAGQIPFTPAAKKVLELSLQQAISFGSDHIGTEHLLLGLAALDQDILGLAAGSAPLDEGVAKEILRSLRVTAEDIRHEVFRLLPGKPSRSFEPEPLSFRLRRPPRRRPLPPLSENLRQALSDAVDAVEAARTTAERDDDPRRMAIIVHVEGLLESLLDALGDDPEPAPG